MRDAQLLEEIFYIRELFSLSAQLDKADGHRPTAGIRLRFQPCERAFFFATLILCFDYSGEGLVYMLCHEMIISKCKNG